MDRASDAATLAAYPYEHTAHHTVRVIPDGLQLELTVVAGAQAIPVSPGWHPYFAVAVDAKTRIAGDGATAGSITDEREINFGGPPPIDGGSRFTVPALLLEASPEMRHVHFWTQPGKPFVCIEPFFGPAGTLNSEARGWVPAGQARTFWMRITA